jgi:hypothetical protein
MKMYHYTAIALLPPILSGGLKWGEIPTTLYTWINGVSLTTDKSPSGHGLSSARFMTEHDLKVKNVAIKDDTFLPVWLNKRKVRITMNLKSTNLSRWLRWSKWNNEPFVRDALIRAGGGVSKARTWYFSLEPIPPKCFQSVEVYDNGYWISYDDYQGPMHDILSDKAIELGFSEWGPQIFYGRSPEQLERLKNVIGRAANANVAGWRPEHELELEFG